jgi:catechol 2,3-dioxygenase-like lactoylglutathione lyase family enzyme
MTDAISHITIGVADLGRALELWVETFGLETIERRHGHDAGLGRLWDIPAAQIADQALIATPGAATGRLHLVQFNDPDPPVRQGAAVTDLGPKNLDVNCIDMPARFAELTTAGHRFRSAISAYEVGGIHAREVQMPCHDDTNIVLIEILSDGFEMRYSAAGYAAVTSFVVIVPDTLTESRFYSEIFDFDELMHHRITGPGIEAAVGLPVGSAIEMRLMGRHEKFFGRVELIRYENQPGVDRFPLARPPALGTLHCSFKTDSVDEVIARADRSGTPVRRFDDVETIFGAGSVCTLITPAGFRVEVFSD